MFLGSRLASLLIVLSAFIVCCLAIEVLVDPPVRFTDEEKAPKYIIGVSKDGGSTQVLSPGREGDRIMTMTDRAGDQFVCGVPPPSANASTADGPGLADEAPQTHPQPSELLQPLDGQCLYRAEDWWTYELCVGKGVRQYHQEAPPGGAVGILPGAPEAQLVQISLGTFNAELSDVNEIQVDLSSDGSTKDSKYVRQVYSGGEPCEITGGKRQTEVRYSCGEGAHDIITSIKEPSTCNYVMIVSTPRLCEHPAHRILKMPVSHILCKKVPASTNTVRSLLEAPPRL